MCVHDAGGCGSDMLMLQYRELFQKLKDDNMTLITSGTLAARYNSKMFSQQNHRT